MSTDAYITPTTNVQDQVVVNVDENVVKQPSPSRPKRTRGGVTKDRATHFTEAISEVVLKCLVDNEQIGQIVKRKCLPIVHQELNKLSREQAHSRVKRPHDPNCPKKPVSAYFLFQNSQRETIQQTHLLKGEALSKKIGSIWKEMTEEAKTPYKIEANKNLEQHRIQMAEYTEHKKQTALENMDTNTNTNTNVSDDTPTIVTDVNVTVVEDDTPVPAKRKSVRTKKVTSTDSDTPATTKTTTKKEGGSAVKRTIKKKTVVSVDSQE